MEDQGIQLIDVRKVVAAKAPKLARWMPAFLFRWLEKLVAQNELNDLYSKVCREQGADVCRGIVRAYDITTEIRGAEHLSRQGRYIFASNHPLGGMDGIVLSALISDYYDKVYTLVNDILLIFIPNFKGFFVPINKTGGQSKAAVKGINEAFDSDHQIITFPAGLVSRKQSGGIKDLEWKKAFVAKARETQRDIVPIYFEGKNSDRFYNFSLWRRRLGIKINLDMLLLPAELVRCQKQHYRIIIGQPIPYTALDKSRTDAQWAEQIKTTVYSLPTNR